MSLIKIKSAIIHVVLWQKISYNKFFNILFTLFSFLLLLQSTNGNESPITLISSEGVVEFSKKGSPWVTAINDQQFHYGDKIRTGEYSRAAIQMPTGVVLRLNEFSSILLRAPTKKISKSAVNLKKGALYFFSRENPETIEVTTAVTTAAIKGTEFELHIENDGSNVLTLIDGNVDLTTDKGNLSLSGGEIATIQTGHKPEKSAIINVVNTIQWSLYYPAIIDLNEINFTPSERNKLAKSLSHYQSGNLLNALKSFPATKKFNSKNERIYLAGLLLATGQVKSSEKLLSNNQISKKLKDAVVELIATVKGDHQNLSNEPVSSSQWLARSYSLQVSGNLADALDAAKKATELSPNFGYAWARLAELEFSFGNRDNTLYAIEKCLAVSPQNAQALTIIGFLQAGENKLEKAKNSFEQAIKLDSALANAWLGSGLIDIRKGSSITGIQKLKIAAALEPNRSILRSYLAKALFNNNEFAKAENELQLAKNLDPNDPTPLLYSALHNQQINRYNKAVSDMEKSLQLNDNRRLYRSKFLLDQDSSVRSANLASIYKNLGMTDISIREATKAVENDYSNYSSHLFLANSYDALRDPKRIQLRYETAWFNELLLANLLSPVNAGTLSQHVSLQEYSSLFEKNKLGVNAQSTYFSHGEFRQLVSQYGIYDKTSYSIDVDYHTFDGFRTNNNFDRLEVFTQLKHQLSPKGTLFFQTKFQDYTSGDLFLRQNAATARPKLDFSEEQLPIALVGYHHHWAPGVDTLILGGRLENKQMFSDRSSIITGVTRNGAGNGAGNVTGVGGFLTDIDYESKLEIYTAEINQIFQKEKTTLNLGTRVQFGDFNSKNLIASSNPIFTPFFTSNPAANSDFTTDFFRFSAYGYYYWKVFNSISFTTGVTYDYIEYPINFRSLPVSDGTNDKDQVSPKVGLTWNLSSNITLRAVYTQALGGVSFDESIRLEPVQLSGFVQGFRSLIPESVAGSVEAPEFETVGVGTTWKFNETTFIDIQAELLEANVDRTIGVFGRVNAGMFSQSSTLEELDYEEKRFSVTVNKLYGENISIGGRYEFIQSELDRRFPEIPQTVTAGAISNSQSTLQLPSIYAIYNHASGFFSKAEGKWLIQNNHNLPNENIFQLDAFFGYRAAGRLWDITFGVVNINDQDFQVAPLSPILELPRERSFFVQFKVNL